MGSPCSEGHGETSGCLPLHRTRGRLEWRQPWGLCCPTSQSWCVFVKSTPIADKKSIKKWHSGNYDNSLTLPALLYTCPLSTGAQIVGVNCHFDPMTCVEAVRLMKEGVERAGLKAHYMVQPLAFHTPDCNRQGFIDLPEFPFGTLSHQYITIYTVKQHTVQVEQPNT